MTLTLLELRGLRSAPALDASARSALRQELLQRVEGCDWFTIGVMAPNGSAAIQALRALEQALHWQPLEADPSSPDPNDVGGSAFLKGNQNNGRFLLRPESGLGEGLLITGHNVADPTAEDTWGPLPLNLFD